MKTYMKKLFVALNAAALISSSLVALPGTEASKQRDQLAKATVLGIATMLGTGHTRLWKSTRNPQQRDVLYEPHLNSDGLLNKNEAFTLFFTRAAKLRYAAGDMVDLESVKDVAEQALKAKALQLVEEPDFNDFISEDFPEGFDNPDYVDAVAAYEEAVGSWTSYAGKIKDFLGRLTFQEHRVGAVFDKEWVYGQAYASVRTWFGLAERNYWLDQTDRDGITLVLKNLFPNNDGTFNLSDYVTTTVGLGDTHVRLGWITPLKNKIELRSGVKAILPTAHEAKRSTAHQVVPLRLDRLQDFGRKRLNEVLIAPRLGNGGHFGAGLWTDATWEQRFFNGAHRLKLRGYAGIDYLIESTEERLFLRRPDASLELDYKLADEFGETRDGDFRSLIGQYLLPEVVEVVIAPGAVATIGCSADYRFGHFGLHAGYDWYARSEEKMIRFAVAQEAGAYQTTQEVDPAAGIQHKVFGGISYDTECANVTIFGHLFPRLWVTVGVQGGAALKASGMGKDYGVGLSFGIKC